MSLQVWLPFTDGTLKQQGVKNVSATAVGTVGLTDNGKLGKCATFNGGGGITLPPSTMTSFTECSVVFWINITAWNTNWDTIFQAGLNSTPWNHYIFGILRNQGNYLCFTVSNGSNSSQGGYASSNLTVGEWIHLAFTYGNEKCKIYINGILDKEYSASIIPKFTDITNIVIGRGTNGSSYQSKCKLNDFRIYDHCLSPMEVKQISQGLVLHYPLNRQGWGQENLLKNSHIKLDNNGYYVGTYSFANSEEIVTGETYTLSFNGELQDDSQTGWYFNIFPSPYAAIINKSTDKEGRFAFSFIMPENDGKHTAIGCYSTPLGNKLGCAIWNVKLEKGSIATPWCPNSFDELATTMGLNSTTEYDCSGFCNNGTRTGTFSWTSNTPKYVVSQVFNGTDNAIQTPSLPTMVSDKNYTVACWTYKTVIGTKNYQTIYGGPSGFELEARSSSSTSPLYRIHNWGGGTTAYNFGEWTHFCFVHTDSDSKLYVNGELKITGTSVNIPSGNYFVGAWNTSTQQNFEGSMSDFRIYATALSASDVLSLYQNSAYIDSSGNVYGAVHTEA